ncbi:hypothetical protein QR680_015159 [Steinernema hermaphroditum]|uniref:DM2 domain-containing protein n=1 Tax=Steinernema hermaphroditum TaxID=289476 RepID=A0AA39IDN3_9BILA|nr:hypothetical protein QR680_015159 [Steinernema hermaphroditum]
MMNRTAGGYPGPMPNGTPQNGHMRYMQGPPPSAQRRPFPPQHMPAGVMMPPQQRPHVKRKRFADKVISANIRELVPESDAYMDLLNYEQKLDATISRKRLEIQEALKKPMKIKRKLRIYVSHSFQPINDSAKEPDGKPEQMWELRVEGRIMDDSQNPEKAGQQPPPSTNKPGFPKRKFSSFFKRLVIELDREIYGPDSYLVEWQRSPQTNETDGFQVKRTGDRNVRANIRLWLDHSPSKFKLHPTLAKILGISTDTRQKIVEALWEYIKIHKLQDPDHKEYINLDAYLEQVFRVPRMRFGEIPHYLNNHLYQPDPIELIHLIKTPVEEKNTACYDIEVEVDDPMKMAMNNFMFSLQRQQTQQSEMQMLETKILDIVEQINDVKMKRDFYARITQDPAEFIDKWVTSQSQDLKTISEAIYEADHEQKSDCYHQSNIPEGVNRYIFMRTRQKRIELEHSLAAYLHNGH